jgi:hypothetical protein
MWRLIADYDSTELADIDTGLTGIGKYRFVDTRVQNGFFYWYAVTAYDRGTFRRVIDNSHAPPETTLVRNEAPKFGKFTQNMTKVMPRPRPPRPWTTCTSCRTRPQGERGLGPAETDFEPTGRRIVSTCRLGYDSDLHAGRGSCGHDRARRCDNVGTSRPAGILEPDLEEQPGYGERIYIYHVRSDVDGARRLANS